MWKFCYLLILPCIGAAGCSVTSFRATTTHQWSFAASDVTEIDVETLNGAIKIERIDGEQVDVESVVTVSAATPAIANQRLQEIVPTVHVENDRMYLRVEKVPFSISASVAFVVRMPHAKSISAKTSNGSIVAHVPSHWIEAKTSNGKISVKGLTGKAILTTSNGNIEVSDTVAELTAKTSNGSIQAQFSPVGNQNELRTSNGRVEVFLPQGRSIEIDASTSNGSVRCDLPLEPGEKRKNTSLMATTKSDGQAPASALLVRTSNGSITFKQLEPESISEVHPQSEVNLDTLDF